MKITWSAHVNGAERRIHVIGPGGTTLCKRFNSEYVAPIEPSEMTLKGKLCKGCLALSPNSLVIQLRRYVKAEVADDRARRNWPDDWGKIPMKRRLA